MAGKRSWLLAAALGSCLFALPEEAADRGREAFVAAHQCEIAGRLAQIHADPRDAARYLILSDVDWPDHYVQCLLDQSEPMLCEAASGFYGNRPDNQNDPLVPPRRLAALRDLGFSTDSTRGNFQKTVDVPPGQFSTIAALMLRALYDGYSPHPPRKLKIDAPYGPGGRKLREQCAPVS